MAPADEATQTPEADESSPQPAEPVPTSSDPPEKDWKAEYARLRKEFDAKSARLKEIEPKEPTKVEPEDDIDFKIENAPRIKLVKEEYKQHLSDLQSAGAKLTPALMQKALRLAELDKGITASSPEAQRQAGSASAPGTVDRTLDSDDTKLSETDRRFGIKAETKKKYQDIVEG